MLDERIIFDGSVETRYRSFFIYVMRMVSSFKLFFVRSL